eukprot:jgi/Mesvir1/18624/Mv17133-RA.1
MLLRKLGLKGNSVKPFPKSTPAEDALRNLTLQDLTPFSFNGHVFSPAKVVRVYDGDTLKVAVLSPWDGMPTMLTVRMWGTDAEELAPRTCVPDREDVKCRATKARNRLVQLATDVFVETDDEEKSVKDIQILIDTHNQKFVTVQCYGFDCFGRVLGVVYTQDGMSINQKLLDEKLVRPRPAMDRRKDNLL